MKNAAKRLLQSPLIWKLTRPFRRTGCVALTYHRIGSQGERFTHIPAVAFRAQMQWLKENCDVVDPAALRDRIENPPSAPRPSVVVTFDDGYRDYYEQAYPILEELGIPAINFLPTRFIDEGAPFWWDMLDTAVAMTARREAAIPALGSMMAIEDRAAKQAYSRLWKDELKQLPAPDRSPLLDSALEALGMRRDSVPLQRQVMTWDEVRTVSPLTTIGGHTHNHTLMPFLSPSELDDEVTRCRDRIETETGRRPRFFAYPSGAHSPAAIQSVARGGYEVAFTTRPGFNQRTKVEWLALNRIHAPVALRDLAALLTGWTEGQH